ncbi:MAG: GGDEF domain-containing protein, partial [Alphaproteobacteria bacterium]|nr:GGDEF domain-containing protein [Alphaproteobacteria bacterium]
MTEDLDKAGQDGANHAPAARKKGRDSLSEVSALFPSRIGHSLQKKDVRLQSLTRAYLTAFSIIALVSILGHVVTAHITSRQRENANVTFMITNLRSLVDAVAAQASTFRATGNSFDDNLLGGVINELKEKLAEIDASGSAAMIAIFHDPRYLLDRNVAAFADMAGNVGIFERTGQTSKAAAALSALTDKQRILGLNLDQALSQYRASVIDEINRGYNLQLYGVIIILLVLMFEMAFIFRPLVRNLDEYHKSILHLALTDMLTGINNRRAFMQLARAGLDYYKRHKTPFALVIMDLDHFKSVNDTYGHKVGDLVLQHYTTLMRKTLRSHDTLGRIGGEEFAIFLPQTAPEEALMVIERFRKCIADTPCPYTDADGAPQRLPYTSSFGIVAVTQGTWALDELIIKA